MSSISPHNETNTTPNISTATPTPNAASDVHAPVAADAEEASVEQQRFQKLRATTPIFADSSTGTAAPNATANVNSEPQQLRDEEEEAEQQRVTAGVRDRVAVAVLSPMDIETEAEGHHETKDGGSGIVPSSAATAQQQSLQQQQQPYVCPTPSATPSKGRRATSTYKTAKDVMGGNVKNSDFGIGDRNAPPEISADGGGGEGGGGAPASNTHSSGSSRPGIFSRILSIINRVMPASPIVISSGPEPIHFKRLDLSDVTPATFLFDSDKANRNSALAHRHTADGTEAAVAAHHPSDAANEASQMSTATPKKLRRSPRSAAATPQKGGVPSMTKGTNNNAFLGPNAHHQPYHQMNPYAPNGPSPWQNHQPHPHPGDPNFFAPYANSYANPYLQQQQQGYPPYMMGVPQGAGGGMFAMYPSQQGALAGSTRKSSANAALFGAAPPPPPGYAEATTPSQGVASLRRRSRAASINLSRYEEGGAPVANEESADTATPPVEAVVSRNPSKCVSRSIMGHAHKTPLPSRAPSPNGSYRAGVGAASQHNENSSAILNAEGGGNAHQNGEAANPSTPPPPSYNNAAEAVAVNNSNNKAAAPSSTMRLSLAALQQHMPHSTAMATGSGSFTPASRRSVAVAGHPSPASYQNTPHSAMYRLPLSQQQAQQAAAILDTNTLSMMMGHAISNNNSFANSNYNSHASTPQHHSHAGGGGSGAASAPAAAYCSHCGSSTPTAMQQQQQQLPLQRQAALMPPPPPPQMPLRSRPQQQQQWLGPAVLPPPTHIARQPYSNNSSINNAFVAAPPPFPPMQQQPYGFGAAPIASAPFAAKGSVLPQQPFYGHNTNQNYFGGGHNNFNNNSGGGVGYGYGGGGSGFGSGPAAFPLHQQGMMMQTTAEPPLSHNKYGFLRRMKTRAYKDHQKELEADLEEEGEAQQQQFFLQ